MFKYSTETTALVAIIILCVVAYLLGSISFAVIFSKLFTGKDVREQGSGNAGMTNVMRTSGKLPGILTFLCDFLKGTLAVVLAMNFFSPLTNLLFYNLGISGSSVFSYIPAPEAIVNTRLVGYLAAIFCMLGHIFPVFFRFKGGKGVATIVGTAAAFNPITALCCFTFFILLVLITKYVSVSSIAAVTLAIPLNYLFYSLLYNTGEYLWFGEYQLLISTILMTIMSLMVILKHHENIGRLIKGTENKIGSKKKG